MPWNKHKFLAYIYSTRKKGYLATHITTLNLWIRESLSDSVKIHITSVNIAPRVKVFTLL